MHSYVHATALHADAVQMARSTHTMLPACCYSCAQTAATPFVEPVMSTL
jgi:hypothetical protein